MGKIYDVNKLYVTKRLNGFFDSMRYLERTDYAFRQNSVLRSGTVHRYAKNYEHAGMQFTAMIIITDKTDDRIEAWMDKAVPTIPQDRLQRLGIRPVDTGVKYSG